MYAFSADYYILQDKKKITLFKLDIVCLFFDLFL